MRSLTTLRFFTAFNLIVFFTLQGGIAAVGQDVKISEKDVKKYLDAAEKEIKDGNLQKAGGYYLAIVTNFPDRGDVHLKLARVYKQLNDWANAGEEYGKAVGSTTVAAEQAECYEGMTIAYAKAANYVKVVEVGKKAAEMNPASAEVLVALATGLAKTGAITEAGQIAQKALALAPNSALVHATIGEAALADGKIDAAEPAFRKAIELDANVAEAHAGLAEILLVKKDYDGAVAESTKALELNSQLTRAFGVRGKANNALGKADAAYSDLAMAITVNANDPDANLAFAEVYQAQGNLGMAANYYQKAVDLNPNLSAPYSALGEIYTKQGKYQELGLLMMQGLKTMPANAHVHYYMGIVYEKSQDPYVILEAVQINSLLENLKEAGLDAAAVEMERRKALDEADARQYAVQAIRDAFGTSEATRAIVRRMALAEFSKAVELDDSLSSAHYQKGRILRIQKQVAPALVELEKAVSLQADNPDYLTELGVGYYEGQQVDKALETLAKAASLPEYENALGWAYYGVALKDKQQFGEAAGYFQKAIDAYPNFGLAHWGLAWSSFGQIAKGCPCTPEDEALKNTLVEHAKLATQYGVNDPGLTERADILGRGEKVK